MPSSKKLVVNTGQKERACGTSRSTGCDIQNLYEALISASRGGRIVSGRPNVAPERVFAVSVILLFSTLYTFNRTANSCVESRKAFSARTSRWWTFGYDRVPI